MFGVSDETEKLHIVEIGEENNDTIDRNDTVVEIKSSDEAVTNRGAAQPDESRKHRLKKKKTEAELLKTSLYNDLGLYFNDVMKGKSKEHEQSKDLHVDHISRERRNIVWVNPIFPSEPSYHAMSEGDRNPFIRKVFTMVCFNMIIIIAFGLLVINVEFFNDLFRGMIGTILGIVGLVLLLIADYILIYDYGKTCPCTGIAWGMAVVGACLVIACMIVKAQIMEVIIAFIATLAVVLLCIGLACTSFDFTKFYLYLMVIGLVLAVFSFGTMLMVVIFKKKFTILKVVIACGFAIFHSLSLIMEIQMVIGGHTLEIEPTQYILGGVMITLSIVFIFINILKIVIGLSDGGD